MIRTEYSILKEVIEDHECGWSKSNSGKSLLIGLYSKIWRFGAKIQLQQGL
jgi:hypothetical protein